MISELVSQVDENTPKMFLYRLYRDQARINGILNHNEIAAKCFDKAAAQIGGEDA